MNRAKLRDDDLNRVLHGLLVGPSTKLGSLDDLATPNRKRIKPDVLPARLNVDGMKLKLVPNAQLFVGGSGIVLECQHETVDVRYALKVMRPSLIRGKLAQAQHEIEKAEREFVYHSPLAHQNIARVVDIGKVSAWHASGLELPFRAIQMEWIDGAMPLLEYLTDAKRTLDELVGIIKQSFLALSYLHNQKLIHWDIKSDNLLVDGIGIVKLMDIGNARRQNDPSCGRDAYSTHGNYPELLEGKVGGIKKESANRVAIVLPDDSWDAPWVDLWMLARELNRAFGFDLDLYQLDLRKRRIPDLVLKRSNWLSTTFSRGDRANYSRRYLDLIIRRLLYIPAPREDFRPEAPPFYGLASEVVEDLEKLHPTYGAAQRVAELEDIPQHVVRTPVWGNVVWTPRIHRLFNCNVVSRLSRHAQLGTAQHVYPGATHRRFEHSIGVYATVIKYIKALYADNDSVFWRISVTADDVDKLIFAASVHDVGHTAYGHFIEEMRGLVDGRTHEDYVIELLNPNHSTIANRNFALGGGAKLRLMEDRRALLDLLPGAWSADRSEEFLADVAEILRPSHELSAVESSKSELSRVSSDILKLEIMHSILDSAIDADKLDYLQRDAYHSGVQYTRGIDVDRFFQSLTVVHFMEQERIESHEVWRGSKRPHACIAVNNKGVLPLESLLVARYHMFASVYWQHTTRAETAMLQFVIQELVSAAKGNGIKELEDLLDVFRHENDRTALSYLEKRIQTGRGLGRTRRIMLDVMSALMGDRSKLYWSAFELWYDVRGAEQAQKLYERLGSQVDRVNSLSWDEYLEAQRRLRDRLADKLSSSLGISADSGEILVDIPEPHKDQVENVFVVRSDAGSVKALRIQAVSPIADSVSQTFQYWARKIRVYCAPSVWQQIDRKGIDKAAVSRGLQRDLAALLLDPELPLETGDSADLPREMRPGAGARTSHANSPRVR